MRFGNTLEIGVFKLNRLHLQNEEQALEEKAPTIQNAQDSESANANQADNIEVPPPEREITPPPNSKFYENQKQNLDNNLAKNYRGFSVYFP